MAQRFSPGRFDEDDIDAADDYVQRDVHSMLGNSRDAHYEGPVYRLIPTAIRPRPKQAKLLVKAMKDWEESHPVDSDSMQRPRGTFEEERANRQSGRPHWSFPKGMLSNVEASAVHNLVQSRPAQLMAQRHMSLVVPNPNDTPGIVSPRRFAYLDQGIMPSEYMDELKASHELVKRIGSALVHLVGPAVKRSLAQQQVERGLVARAQNTLTRFLEESSHRAQYMSDDEDVGQPSQYQPYEEYLDAESMDDESMDAESMDDEPPYALAQAEAIASRAPSIRQAAVNRVQPSYALAQAEAIASRAPSIRQAAVNRVQPSYALAQAEAIASRAPSIRQAAVNRVQPVASRQDAVNSVRRAFDQLFVNRPRLPAPSMVPRTRAVARAVRIRGAERVARSSTYFRSQSQSPDDLGLEPDHSPEETARMWSPERAQPLPSPLADYLAPPSSVASARDAQPTEEIPIVPPSFASADVQTRDQPPPPAAQLEMQVGETTVQVRPSSHPRDKSLLNAPFHHAMMAIRILMYERLLSQLQSTSALLALPSLHVTPHERAEQIHRVQLDTRSIFDPVGQQLCALLDISEKPVLFGSIMDNLARVYQETTHQSLSLQAIAQSLTTQLDVWPAILSLRAQLLPPQALEALVTVRSLFERATDPQGRNQVIFRRPALPADVSPTRHALNLADTVERIEALEQEDRQIHTKQPHVYQSVVYQQALVDGVRMLMHSPDTLQTFPKRNYTHNVHWLVEYRNARQDYYQQFKDSFRPTIHFSLLRSSGILPALVRTLAPTLFSPYLTCLYHIILSAEEKRAIESLSSEFNRPTLERALKDYMQMSETEGGESQATVKQKRAKAVYRYAIVFCESIELIVLLSVFFLAPYVSAYVHSLRNEVQESAFSLVARDTNGIYFEALVLMARILNRLVSESADSNALRVHTSGIEPHGLDAKPLVDWTKEARALSKQNESLTPLSDIRRIAPKPFRPKGVQWSDIPAQSYATSLSRQIPEQYVPYFFKLQQEWKSGEALERKLVSSWSKMFKGTPYEHVMQSHYDQGEPSYIFGTFASRLPKMTKEYRRQLREATSLHPDNMTDDEWNEMIREQRRERLAQEREDRRAQKRATRPFKERPKKPVEWQQRQMDIFARVGGMPNFHRPDQRHVYPEHVPPRPRGTDAIMRLLEQQQRMPLRPTDR